MKQSINTGFTGAKRQSFNENNPRPILKKLMEDNPSAEIDDLVPMFQSEIGEDELQVIVAYWVNNNYHSLLNQMTRQEDIEVKKATASAKQRGIAAGIKGVTVLAERKAILILNDILPNGKKLGDSTFGELSDIGGVLSKISKLGGPEQRVRDVLSNNDLKLLQS